jgi:hypothetical protein
MKKVFILSFSFLLVFGALNAYAQSSKLIGMWQNGVTYVLISEEFITFYWNLNNRDSRRRLSSYEWKDNNDRLTISVKDEFIPYLVNDNNLLIWLPFNDGVDSKMHFLTKCTVMPPSKLIGNWISPGEPVDIEVTINDDQIIFKKGRLTKEYNYEVNKVFGIKSFETLPGVIGLSTVSKNDPDYRSTLAYSMYFFVDDTHIFIATDPFSEQTSEYMYDSGGKPPMLFLTKQ